jgi:hypothetical protein
MKFNTSHLFLAAIAVVFTASSCKDMLDVKPEQSIDESKALVSERNVRAALIGSYDAVANGNVLGGYLQVYSDLLGKDDDFVFFEGTFEELRDMATRRMTADNASVAQTWISGYRAISLANSVIAAAADTLVVADEDAGVQYVAEARFIRGVVYFELVRLYARAYNDGNPSTNLGIPLLTEKTATLTDTAITHVPRATVQEIYDQVVSDLRFAKTNLGSASIMEDHYSGLKDRAGFASTWAASAYLSRVYMQMAPNAGASYNNASINAWQLAFDEANRVINSNRFDLVNSLSDLYLRGSLTEEDIFGVTVTDQDGVNNLSTFYSLNNRGDIVTELAFSPLFETDDVRALFYTDDVWTAKWDDIVQGDVKIIRLPELLLNRAEAALQLGGAPNAAIALADINRIRTRAGLDLFQNVYATELTLQEVYNERLRELMYEGHFLHDMKRQQVSISGYAWNARELVFPIPRREIEINPRLIQNDGY